MVKTFYLIRHGDKIKTIGDPPLSKKGINQAKTTTLHMRSYPIQQVITSPTLRTQQTARFLADHFSLNVQLEPLLRERVNWGDDPDQSFEDFLAMWKKSTLDRDWIPPAGDSSRKTGSRMQQVIESHDSSHGHIALITHGGIIADFVLNVFNNKDLDQLLPNFSKIKEDSVFECSLTVVDYDPASKQYKLKLLASTDHLAGL